MPKENRKRFDVLQPLERKDRGTYWMRVGTAFENRDGSLNLYLDALPLTGKLQVREARDEATEVENASAKEPA
ncbi:MAG: hypothetical protein JWO36_5739 [Myxococcales bacterium]|nr:hypothetical protein [Myxococcales bacterium]